MAKERISAAEYNARMAGMQEAARSVSVVRDTMAEAESSSVSMAAMGVPYRIGDLEVPPLSLSTFIALQRIGCPFLDKDVDVDMDSIGNTLYIICAGPAAVAPLASLSNRVEAARKMEKLAESKPEYFERYLAHIDRITSKAWDEFHASVGAFLEEAGQFDFDEALETLDRVFCDSMDGFGLLPEDGIGGDEEKKTSTEQSG